MLNCKLVIDVGGNFDFLNFAPFRQPYCYVLTFLCYIGVYFTFGLLDCVRYNEDLVICRFVISRFCFIHFIVTLAGLKNIVCYTKNFAI